MRKSMVIFGALCLAAAFGGAAVSKELRGSQAQAIQLLKAKGAVFGPTSPALKAAGAGGRSAASEVCHGAGACLDMLDRVGTCKHLTCNPDVDGKPSCTCEL
jgi:hypothetical protein